MSDAKSSDGTPAADVRDSAPIPVAAAKPVMALAAIASEAKRFTEDFAEDAPETATVNTRFGVLSRKELEDVLETLRSHSHESWKEASASFRQLCLGGLAVVWLFKFSDSEGSGAVLFSDEMRPAVFLLIAGLAADALYWGVNAVFWGLGKRLHLRYKVGRFADALMSLLTKTERIHGIPAPRSRLSFPLIVLEVVFTSGGLLALAWFLARRTHFWPS